GSQTFENFGGETARRCEGELQRMGVRDAASVTVRGSDLLLLAQGANLCAGAMHQNDPDIQRAQYGDIKQAVREILVGHNGAIDAQNERLFAEARNVLQDAPQVSRFQFAPAPIGSCAVSE